MLDIKNKLSIVKNKTDFNLKLIAKKYNYINNNETKIQDKISNEGARAFNSIKQDIEKELETILFKINTLDKIIQFLSEDINTRDAIEFITKFKK